LAVCRMVVVVPHPARCVSRSYVDASLKNVMLAIK
jgi:hypothetical protein